MKQYIAMTLGPITRVISFARKPKELWAASYLFSYLAKQLIVPFKKRTFLLPYLCKGMDNPELTKGVGVYPDRYVFEAKEGDFDLLCKQVDFVMYGLANRIANIIDMDVDCVESYLRSTLKVCFFEQEFDESKVDVVAVCEARFALLECQDVHPPFEQKNYLQLFFSRVNDSFLVEDGFGKEKKGRLFETVLECASQGRVVNKGLLPYQKYIALVSADGDNLTATIMQLKKQGKDVLALSDALFYFSIEAIKLIDEFGGQAFYAGGDDLVFFAPVMRENKITIFDLIAAIDTAFREKMVAAIGGETPSSMSYGVSITYYKYPLFEALQQAHGLLREAKESGKNRVAWCLRKHSGQKANDVISKKEKALYDQFNELMRIAQKVDDQNEFLHSFTYWLETNHDHLQFLLENPAERDCSLLENCLTNNFNEDVHVDKVDFMGKLVNYLIAFQSSTVGEKTKPDAVRSLVSILRLMAFLLSKRL